VSYLAELGIGAENDADATWDDVIVAAGFQPMLIGGRGWYHWTGVRLWSGLVAPDLSDGIALANPAPGWMGIDQVMLEGDFHALGGFSAVWFTSW